MRTLRNALKRWLKPKGKDYYHMIKNDLYKIYINLYIKYIYLEYND